MARSGTFVAPAGFRDSPARALGQGEVVDSTYMIRDELVRTDTGVVFEARDMLLERLVAFKLAWRDPGTPPLLAEARRCAAVNDPCAVQVHRIGHHNGAEYAVAERVAGDLLHTLIAEPLLPDAYLARLRTLVGAVTRAHEAGIAVGEISGATVLAIPDDGRMVLGRLSLSQVPAFGRHGRVLAPEVARGEVDPADPAAAEAIDLYGLGCVAIELACGKPPFSSSNSEHELRDHVESAPPRLADLRTDLPVELSDLVEWLLAKQPAARPRSARDVLAQLDTIRERVASSTRTVRVQIVDDDTSRARWLWSLARRGHAGALIEVASEGTDAAHKLVRDMPDVLIIHGALRGVMNASELCTYWRSHEGSGTVYVIGDVPARDRPALTEAQVRFIPDDARLADSILDVVRAAANDSPRRRRRSRVTG
jgi:hypothetical protein